MHTMLHGWIAHVHELVGKQPIGSYLHHRRITYNFDMHTHSRHTLLGISGLVFMHTFVLVVKDGGPRLQD